MKAVHKAIVSTRETDDWELAAARIEEKDMLLRDTVVTLFFKSCTKREVSQKLAEAILQKAKDTLSKDGVYAEKRIAHHIHHMLSVVVWQIPYRINETVRFLEESFPELPDEIRERILKIKEKRLARVINKKYHAAPSSNSASGMINIPERAKRRKKRKGKQKLSAEEAALRNAKRRKEKRARMKEKIQKRERK